MTRELLPDRKGAMANSPYGICAACRSTLILQSINEEAGAILDIACENPKCELDGLRQVPDRSTPREVVGFGSDGTVTTLVYRLPYSQNEENLAAVAQRLNRYLIRNGIQHHLVDLLDESAGEECGIDLLMTCSRCKTDTELQVARDVDSDFARARRGAPVTSRTSTVSELAHQLQRIVEKKTKLHGAGRRDQVLAIDAIESFWPLLMSTRSCELKRALDGYGWKAILIVGMHSVFESCAGWVH